MTKRFTHLRTRYGITEEQHQALYEKQNGLCAGCGELPRPGGKSNANANLFVDHNHYTDEVRGLLCQGCNAAVGLAQDNPKTLRALADYLESGPAISLSDIIPKDKGRYMRERMHCNHGHEFSPENTKWRTWKGRNTLGRVCRTCEKVWESKRKTRIT